MKPLLSYAKNITSQAGEDGILNELFKRIGVENKWCCEFGAWDGKHLSNTWLWINKAGWSSVQIEGGNDKFTELESRYKDNEKVFCLNEFVSQDNSLDFLLAQTPCPKDLDFLVIDIDGNDYWIWKWLTEYRPRVVLIEFNSTMPPELHFIQKYNPNIWCGSSLRALVHLGKEKGYELVTTIGGNAIFVCKEDFEKVQIEDNSIENLFCSPFLPLVISDQTGYHYILRVGPYGMLKEHPNDPLINFQMVGGAPGFAEEIFIEQSTDEKQLRSIFRRGWEEVDPQKITPIQIETFHELRGNSKKK
jgi:hypothetical protein